ncbi:MAG: hypothetical protein UW95_C0012G0017 [Parcubacteria group bacterium GW2011_GWC1_45_14]|nr:MAG: hypothetical protein UW87_C0029G0010 [Candidatus Moranbacteria bacterium GW2011_GWC2_45_10]KKT94601.1 MAG: hypothetical protein UW95_C0012G0017 [Parcubacteria group bacterium GW2011_GWC1_45_14]
MYQGTVTVGKSVIPVSVRFVSVEVDIIFNAGRVAKVVFKPQEATDNDDICKDIIRDFRERWDNSFFMVENGNIIFFCRSGNFVFPLDCSREEIETVKKQIRPGNVCFEDKLLGFSLNAG